ncbi:MAG: tetratricopeptide repeat protein [Gammaproteobacteria bacterium]
MLNLSLQAVITLTEWSERTVRRRLADGSLKCSEDSGPNNRILICYSSIQKDVCIPVSTDDIKLIGQADAGEPGAQTDLALLFLGRDKLKSALYWLELAAKQNYPDAMHWLGECYLNGRGVTRDYNLAVMWIAKAASGGHFIAMRQIEAMRPGANASKAAFLEKGAGEATSI